MPERAATEKEQPTEAQRVLYHRFTEARDAGLTRLEARKFVASTTDVGILRKLVAGRCPPRMIAKIVT